MTKVIIGVDPHELSATIEVVDGHERLLGSGRCPALPQAKISDALYRQLVADAQRAGTADSLDTIEAGPGGHCGATQESSAADLPPHIDTSDQPLPGPRGSHATTVEDRQEELLHEDPAHDRLTTKGSRKVARCR